MRYIVMHKVDANMEAGGPPSRKIIEEMGALVGSSIQEGIFLDGDGLHRSARRVRVRFSGGSCTVTKGPLQGENELVANMVMIKARSMDEAVEHARKFAALGDGEIDIGPVVEAWDIGLGKKPENVEEGRFLFLRKANAAFESGAPEDPKLREIVDSLAKAGVLLKAETLAPSAKGARLPVGPRGKRTWTDGPFAESKEMIAGFSILEVPSKEAAIAWANRYADILEVNEVDVRLMA